MAKKIFGKGTLENLGQRVANAAQTGVEKSKKLAELARLKANCISEEEAIKKAYLEIGKLYYAERGAAPEGAYVALCSRISKAKDIIEQNKAEMEQLKARDEEIVLEGEFSLEEMDETVQPIPEVPVEEAPEPAPEEESAPAEETPAPEEAVEVDPVESDEE